MIPFELIKAYRAKTFRLRPGSRIKTREEAVDYVNQRGFVYFWPIKDIIFPSLWTAVAGDRPVADAHDDPGHVTWGWKDSLIGSHEWYYAKVLRKRATMISMEIAPFFYALSENYGAPEDDHITLYEQGRMTPEARSVYQAILDNGPLDTVALRKASRLSSPESEGRFNKALADLQAGFLIVPVAVTQAGAWHYAFAYDIVARHYPEIAERARYIGELDAQRRLVELFLYSLGAAQTRNVAMLFGWGNEVSQAVIQYWVAAGQFSAGIQIEEQPGEWFVLRKLVEEQDE
jgi:hypothetical protein